MIHAGEYIPMTDSEEGCEAVVTSAMRRAFIVLKPRPKIVEAVVPDKTLLPYTRIVSVAEREAPDLATFDTRAVRTAVQVQYAGQTRGKTRRIAAALRYALTSVRALVPGFAVIGSVPVRLANAGSAGRYDTTASRQTYLIDETWVFRLRQNPL